MAIWDFWEQAYKPNEAVDVRIRDQWTPGIVDREWRPTSGGGVVGWLEGDRGQFRATNGDEVRPRWAANLPNRGERVLVTAEFNSNIYSWPATVVENLSDSLTLVELDGLAGNVIVKPWMMRGVERAGTPDRSKDVR